METKRGFSLVELMVVVAIVGILAAIGIPTFMKYIQRSKTSEATTIMKNMKDGASSYYMSSQMYSTSDGSEPWHTGQPPGTPVPGTELAFPGGNSGFRTHKNIPEGGAKLEPDYLDREGDDVAILDAMSMSITEPTYFLYRYKPEAQGDTPSFNLNACHDFSGDNRSGSKCSKNVGGTHHFLLECEVENLGSAPTCGGIIVANEFE